MHVTITSIKLRSVWKFFALSNNGRKIQGQAKNTAGFIQIKNTGWGKLHFTLSSWESVEAMKQFARSGAHLDAMKQSAKLSTEIRTYTYETNTLPNWAAAKALLFEKGKLLQFPT